MMKKMPIEQFIELGQKTGLVTFEDIQNTQFDNLTETAQALTTLGESGVELRNCTRVLDDEFRRMGDAIRYLETQSINIVDATWVPVSNVPWIASFYIGDKLYSLASRTDGIGLWIEGAEDSIDFKSVGEFIRFINTEIQRVSRLDQIKDAMKTAFANQNELEAYSVFKSELEKLDCDTLKMFISDINSGRH